MEATNQILNNDVNHAAEVSEKVLRCFIFEILEKVIDQESASGQLDFSSIPRDVLNELKAVKKHVNECRAANAGNDIDKWILNKILSVLNDEVEFTIHTYHKTFYKLMSELDLTNEFSFAYDTFVSVCKKMFKTEMTWYHVIALLCFGSEIAVYVIKRGGPGVISFLEKVVHFVVEFIVKEEIAHWISEHGGWMKMVNFFDEQDCPDRVTHILSIMTISEYTHMEVWLQRFVVAAVCTGLVLTATQIFTHK